MNKERMFNIEKNWRVMTGVLATTGALALAGCGGGESKPQASATTTSAPTPAESQPNSPSAVPKVERATLVFDSIGSSGSTITQVYPGVKDTPVDKKFNGTYNDGDTIAAECRTEGRTVNSDTSLGEEDRTSNDWVRIQGTPNETQYATAVYVKNPAALLNVLPYC